MTGYLARRGDLTGVTIWRVRSAGPVQTVAPDGVMDLMWYRGRLIVAGADTRAMHAETQTGDVTWGLQFAPGVVYALFGVSAHELTDQRVELRDLVTLPRDRMHSFDDSAPDALEHVFLSLWRATNPDRSVLRLAASLDRASRRGQSVAAMAEHHDLSTRSLHRLSNTLFGYAPKTLMQIHRFQHALRLARSGLPLAEVAATAGYADQAHFTRETKRLTGETPARLTRVA